MKGYTFKTITQIASELVALPLNTSVDFTFDTPEEENEAFEPSGWFGVKRTMLFDEDGTLVIGYYGGGCLCIETLYNTEPMENQIEKILQRFCDKYENRNVTMLCVSNEYNGG